MTNPAEAFDTVLDAAISPNGPGAAAAVLRDGEFLHCKGYGLANVEWGNAMTPDTVCHIASLTKQFTATAIMMLRERGLVALDTPLQTYLPDFPAQGRRLTVRHLLNHTSGIRTHSALEAHVDGTMRRHQSLQDLVTRIATLPFDFEPGERYLYNNSGYVLLGAIIESAGGLKYRDFLNREIFRPLGMAKTSYLFDEPIVPHRAAGYQLTPDGIANAPYVSATFYHASGGLGSTVCDLAKWDRAIRTHRLISADSFGEMLCPTVLNDGSEFPYGYGWGTANYRGHRIYHHAGGISGFACHMLHCRDEDLTTIVLSNLDRFPFDRVTRGLVGTAFAESPFASELVRATPRMLDACAGRFRPEGASTPGWGERTVVVTNGGLTFAEAAAPHLLPTGEHRFCEKDDREIEYLFSGLENGRYARFRFNPPLFPPTDYVRC